MLNAPFVRDTNGQPTPPPQGAAKFFDAMKRGVTGVIELAPAGTLAGLAKRGMPGVKTVTVKTPDDLSAALAVETLNRST